VGRVKPLTGVTVGRESLERWQAWQALCMLGHMKHCATSFPVALVPACDRSRGDWNIWSRKGAGTYGRGFSADVSQ
jgi:hypothetical protein